MTTKIKTRLHSRLAIISCLALTLPGALPAEALAHPPSPC